MANCKKFSDVQRLEIKEKLNLLNKKDHLQIGIILLEHGIKLTDYQGKGAITKFTKDLVPDSVMELIENFINQQEQKKPHKKQDEYDKILDRVIENNKLLSRNDALTEARHGSARLP